MAGVIFKAVGDTRPYPDHGYSTRQWSNVPPRLVRLDDLVTTKRTLDLGMLLSEDSTFYGDLFAHVVEHEGTLYLEDGLHRAVRHEPEGGGAHGFLNVLVATQVLWDGGSVADATDVLEQRDGQALAATEIGSARRWFTSFGSCSVTEPLDDLIALGLISHGRAEHP